MRCVHSSNVPTRICVENRSGTVLSVSTGILPARAGQVLVLPLPRQRQDQRSRVDRYNRLRRHLGIGSKLQQHTDHGAGHQRMLCDAVPERRKLRQFDGRLHLPVPVGMER